MIYFYNTCHNGDIHYSREFIKDIMNKIQDDFCYLHNNNKLILNDIENLKYNNLHFKSFIYEKGYPESITKKNDDIFINTWIGQNHMIYAGKYGCTLLANYEMYKNIYNMLNIILEKDMEFYNPSIDFSKFDIKLTEHKILKDSKLKILICNNIPIALPFKSIDLNIVADELSSKFKDVLFILTNDSNLNKENIIHMTELTGVGKSYHSRGIENKISVFNLIDISYLSLFCDIIVGKPSGPFCFTHIKDNLNDKNKVFVTCSETVNKVVWYENTISKVIISTNNQKIIDDVVFELIENGKN